MVSGGWIKKEMRGFLLKNILFLASISFIIQVSMTSLAFSGSDIKSPNVSGQFYSADPKKLSRELDQFLSKADTNPSTKNIEIIIAPHAGYVYSGSVAAHSFKAASQKKIKTVIILAPDHFFGFDGISIWDRGAFETPLGLVEVDQILAKKLTSFHPKIYFEPNAFAREHSLEVEIPFLQKTFSNFKIVPVVMGQPNLDVINRFVEALADNLKNRDDVLIVVSTDFSHYHSDDIARQMDQNALEAIRTLNAQKILEENRTRRNMEMCGVIPVVTALLYAQRRGIDQVEILNYANSGDINGDRSRVVGYAAVTFSRSLSADVTVDQKQENLLSDDQKRVLLKIARDSMVEFLRNNKKLVVKESDPRLSAKEGAFVTIHRDGRLRGCIGRIVTDGPLYQTIRDMAISSATEDHRFSPMTANEMSKVDLEVSVLSTPQRVKSADEIVLGIHGVIIKRGGHQGVFLPQVADETGWSKEQFLSELCSQKAGLPPDCWKDSQTELYIFSAQVFSEKEL